MCQKPSFVGRRVDPALYRPLGTQASDFREFGAPNRCDRVFAVVVNSFPVARKSQEEYIGLVKKA